MTLEEYLMAGNRTFPEKVYFTAAEGIAIEDRAERLGLSKSSYIRQIVLLDLQSSRQRTLLEKELGVDRTELGLN